MQVLLKIAKESTTEGEETAGRKKNSSNRKDRGRSTGPVDRRARHAQELERSTGPVDRRAMTDKPQLSGCIGRPARSTDNP